LDVSGLLNGKSYRQTEFIIDHRFWPVGGKRPFSVFGFQFSVKAYLPLAVFLAKNFAGIYNIDNT